MLDDEAPGWGPNSIDLLEKKEKERKKEREKERKKERERERKKGPSNDRKWKSATRKETSPGASLSGTLT